MKKSIISLSFICFLSTALFAESNTSGKVFFNNTLGLGDGGDNAFNMKRAYLTYTNDVNESVSYKVTYDMGSNDGGSAHTAFLKIAMVKWKTSLGNVMIGMQGMNMSKTMENTWGHRFIDKCRWTPMGILHLLIWVLVWVGHLAPYLPVSLLPMAAGIKKQNQTPIKSCPSMRSMVNQN